MRPRPDRGLSGRRQGSTTRGSATRDRSSTGRTVIKPCECTRHEAASGGMTRLLTAGATSGLPDPDVRPTGCAVVLPQVLVDLDRTGPRTVVRQSPLSGQDLPFGVGVHETTLRVNVRWVTPLGEETASTS
jgi:hypothetical protein